MRIPLGFWIIESTVNADESYPQGGLDFLRAGCQMLKAAGISVLLDLHAAPGLHQTDHDGVGAGPSGAGAAQRVRRHRRRIAGVTSSP